MEDITLGRIPRNGQWIEDLDDRALNVRFYKHAVTGKDHVEISAAADETTVIDRVVTDHDQQRFQQRWHNYENELDQFEGQTRIEAVGWIDRGSVNELRRANIATIEQLSSLSDDVISRAGIIGLVNLRNKAQEHVERAKRMEGYDELSAQNATMQKQIDELLAAQAPKRRGRPPKVETA